MTTGSDHHHAVRRATPGDAALVARLLDDFNREFDTPTPGPEALAANLRRLLAVDELCVLITGEPAAGIAVVTFRPAVWYEGPVALLDELYVRPHLRNNGFGHALLEAACALARSRGAESLEVNVDGVDFDARRFYEAHGFRNIEPGAPEPMYYYYRDLG
ncbi:GNAT family N-acetyltransferase [Nocardia sp. CDC159]|uniref:GNAT family N-acetyltransferase n=1 Tax=Nocardia pulmonis TaxID=2951408 RepID=A0A9X2EDH6_9NOCA|nr:MULTISPECIES: GNAT family N-acetyltransferase [Nocardia]MCM6778341.1 GNAT family N-acetyltransferase [Nocardia pulmonis]MCM6791263.1 GNAT family N-acetyltransferase [Nocardia sp. CDC159]